MNFTRTVVVDFLSRLGRAVISLAAIALFVEELGIGGFGTFVLFEAVLMVGGIFADFGIGSAVQKRIRELPGPEVVSTAITLKLGLLLCLTTIVLLFRDGLNSYLGEPLALFVPLAVGIQQIGRIGLHALRGDLRVSQASFVQLLGDSAFLISGYWFVSIGAGVQGLVYGFLVGWSIVSILTFKLFGYSLAIPTKNVGKSVLDFSRYSFISSVAGGALYSWMDTLVIGYFLTPGAVGIYETAWRVSRAVSLVSQSIGTALFPRVSDWHSTESLVRIRQAVDDSVTASLSVVFPAIIGGILFGTELLSVAFGGETTAAAIPLVVLLIGKLPEAANDVLGRALFGVDLPRYTAHSAILFIAVNIILNLLFVPWVGILGAAIATSIAFTVNTGLNAYYVRKNIGFQPSWWEIGHFVIASLGMGIGLMFVSRLVIVQTAVQLTTIVFLGVLLYATILLLLPGTRRHLREVIGNIRS